MHARNMVTDCILVVWGSISVIWWMCIQLCSRRRAMVFWWKTQKKQAAMTISPTQNLLHFHIRASLEKEGESVDDRSVMVNPIHLKIKCFWHGFAWTTCRQAEIAVIQLKNRWYCRLDLLFLVFYKLSVFQQEKKIAHPYLIRWHDLFSLRFLALNTVNFMCDFFFFLL